MPDAEHIVNSMLDADLDAPEANQHIVADLGDYTVKYLVFTVGSGAYGSGGWSRNARHRPQPTVKTVRTKNVEFKGKSVFIDGQRKLKANVWDWRGQPVRIDYADLKLNEST